MQAGLSSSFSSSAMAVYSLWTKDRSHIYIDLLYISSRMKWIRWDLTSRMKLIASAAAPTKKWLNPTFFSLWIPSVFIYGEKRVSLKRKPLKYEEGDRINQHSIFHFKSGRVDVSWGFDRCNWVWSLLYSFVNKLYCLVLFMLGAGLDAAPPLLVSPR